MYSRIITYPKDRSFFLFGPRSTGKSSWVATEFPDATYIDLLNSPLYLELLADPSRLTRFALSAEWTIIDEVQKIPELLDEVHRLIETQKKKFVLTGSSARKLKRSGTNLLGGRASTRYMHPLTISELGSDFSIENALKFGCLPPIFSVADKADFLSTYVRTYLKEEVEQEGLTRRVGVFSRFLEQISFSQASVLNTSEVARESSINRKVVEAYILVLEDLLLAIRIPVFTKRAKREMSAHQKFFFFDVGVFRAIRPRGPLDSPEEIDGLALETLFMQQVLALNDYKNLGYQIFHWRTRSKIEVDLVLYGERGIKAFEIKRTDKVRSHDLSGLKAFSEDYPDAERFFLYCGEREQRIEGIRVVPIEKFFIQMPDLL